LIKVFRCRRRFYSLCSSSCFWQCRSIVGMKYQPVSRCAKEFHEKGTSAAEHTVFTVGSRIAVQDAISTAI
ncbi:hypothetical protein PENTCL1PPCAC_4772, partial [Pristionchus entomophagus]